MFVKYNGVLRGLDSEVAFLRDEMVRLCCSAEVAAAYGRGALEYTRARSELNTYTTTLHAINSAIVKLSKLTRATTVYRGISGRVLPEQVRRAPVSPPLAPPFSPPLTPPLPAALDDLGGVSGRRRLEALKPWPAAAAAVDAVRRQRCLEPRTAVAARRQIDVDHDHVSVRRVDCARCRGGHARGRQGSTAPIRRVDPL